MKLFIILKNSRITLNLLVISFWVAVWWVIAMHIGNELYFPTPYQTFLRFGRMLPTSQFWYSIYSSMFRVIVGFVLAGIIGIGLGISGGLSKLVFELINPIMISIKATPVVSIILILFMWFDSKSVPIFVCFLMCLPIFWTSMVEGMKRVNSEFLDLARVHNVKLVRKITLLYIPSLKSYIRSAVILSLGLGWRVTVASEVITQPKNTIGAEIYSAKAYFESDLLFAWTVVVIILSYIFELGFRKLLSGRIVKND